MEFLDVIQEKIYKNMIAIDPTSFKVIPILSKMIGISFDGGTSPLFSMCSVCAKDFDLKGRNIGPDGMGRFLAQYGREGNRILGIDLRVSAADVRWSFHSFKYYAR